MPSWKMIQEYHQRQQPQKPILIILYLNKTIMSLDYIQIGNVIGEESHQMMIIITDTRNGVNLLYLSAKLSQLITQIPVILLYI